MLNIHIKLHIHDLLLQCSSITMTDYLIIYFGDLGEVYACDKYLATSLHTFSDSFEILLL